jgi:undecaprenyl-diphosphatase
MTVWQALVLGMVQGLTEFLPISSSGHLLIFQQIFGLGIEDSLLTFDIVIHLATLVAILLFFGWQLFKVSWKEWALVIIGTIPAAIIGVVFKDQLEVMFGSDTWVGVELVLTGLIVLGTDWYLEKRKVPVGSEEPAEASQNGWLVVGKNNPVKSVLIGVAQAVAIVPGISRSGSTVAGAIGAGLDREEAFRFSFLLAIPAIAGAGVLELKDVVEAGTVGELFSLPYLVGAVAALITGILSLKVFKYVIDQAKLEWFGWYCVVVGVIVTGWMWWG